jgi:hypothetical protein
VQLSRAVRLPSTPRPIRERLSRTIQESKAKLHDAQLSYGPLATAALNCVLVATEKTLKSPELVCTFSILCRFWLRFTYVAPVLVTNC